MTINKIESTETAAAKRDAMLEAASRWQGEADTAETRTLRTVAVIIADAFTQEADRYRKPRPSLHDDDDRFVDMQFEEVNTELPTSDSWE